MDAASLALLVTTLRVAMAIGEVAVLLLAASEALEVSWPVKVPPCAIAMVLRKREARVGRQGHRLQLESVQ